MQKKSKQFHFFLPLATMVSNTKVIYSLLFVSGKKTILYFYILFYMNAVHALTVKSADSVDRVRR